MPTYRSILRRTTVSPNFDRDCAYHVCGDDDDDDITGGVNDDVV